MLFKIFDIESKQIYNYDSGIPAITYYALLK